mgnify:CR=1 FL=1
MSEIKVDISDAIAQLPVEQYQEKIDAIHEQLHHGQSFAACHHIDALFCPVPVFFIHEFLKHLKNHHGLQRAP